ncbi:hypothetical protein D3C87_1172180 [compost metagenome]
MVFGNADASVPHFETNLRTAPATTDQNFAARRIFQRIGQKVADDLLEQTRIGANGEAGRHDMELQPGGLSGIVKFLEEPSQKIAYCKAHDLRFHHTRFDLVDVENGVEYSQHRRQRLLHPLNEGARLAFAHALFQKPLQQL